MNSLRVFCCILSLFTFHILSPSLVYAIEATGRGEVVYKTGLFKDGPNAELRREGIRLAKENALRQLALSFDPARRRLFDAAASEILANIDRYVVSAQTVDENMNKSTKTYAVVVRATIDESALDTRLNGENTQNAKTDGSTFVFFFVTRQVKSVTTYEARNTKVSETISNVDGQQSSSMAGGSGRFQESSKATALTSTGGSASQKSTEIDREAASVLNVDSAVSKTLNDAGFSVSEYADVVAQCGGVAPEAMRRELAASDEMSVATRAQAFEAMRRCEVRFFAIGTLDLDVDDIDPVQGTPRSHATFNGQVWDLRNKIARKVASSEPVQFKGLGETRDGARGNALKLAAAEGTRTIIIHLGDKGLH